jgi:hypothetical protein
LFQQLKHQASVYWLSTSRQIEFFDHPFRIRLPSVLSWSLAKVHPFQMLLSFSTLKLMAASTAVSSSRLESKKSQFPLQASS